MRLYWHHQGFEPLYYQAMKPHLEIVVTPEEERELLWRRLKFLCHEARDHRLSNKLLKAAINALEVILEYKADRVIRVSQRKAG